MCILERTNKTEKHSSKRSSTPSITPQGTFRCRRKNKFANVVPGYFASDLSFKIKRKEKRRVGVIFVFEVDELEIFDYRALHVLFVN